MHLAGRLADRGERVAAITKRKEAVLRGVTRVIYPEPKGASGGTHPYLVRFEEAVRHGEAAARAALRLKREGFSPDVVCAHPGWGESLYLKDVFPDAPLLQYCEFFFHAFGGPVHFDPSQPPRPDTIFQTRTRNVLHLLALDAGDWGVTPTRWQHAQYPEAYRARISVIHDGINAGLCRPDPDARLSLPGGRELSRADEVVTYVARNLEPTRGFPTLMRAAAELTRRRPRCEVVVIGGDELSYGAAPAEGSSWREAMLEEVDLDRARVHFLGKVPYATYLKVLQVSSAHVYLTVPFVLSWSVLEAMAAECLVVASDTAPVKEVIEDGRNGLLVDFFDHGAVADRVEEALDRRDAMAEIRRRARETVVARYALAKCLPAQIRLIEDLASGRGRPAAAAVGG
jgi:glycosyltransferase involved in cell wall biosynthesis